MSFENGAGMMDKVFDMDGLKVYVDATSLMYLNHCIVDYVETLEGAGFKFENPNVKSTCGCGSSFTLAIALVVKLTGGVLGVTSGTVVGTVVVAIGISLKLLPWLL